MTWWGRAWVRGLEEAAYHDADLRTARALSRGGEIGGITVDRGRLVASVSDARGLWTASVALPVLDREGAEALVEVVAAQSGRIGSLLAGDLPHSLVEHAEESGVELLPFGSELEASCTCEGWLDPCPHALALLYQATWLLEADPFVLLHLRGLPRDDLLAALHARTSAHGVRYGVGSGDCGSARRRHLRRRRGRHGRHRRHRARSRARHRGRRRAARGPDPRAPRRSRAARRASLLTRGGG